MVDYLLIEDLRRLLDRAGVDMTDLTEPNAARPRRTSAGAASGSKRRRAADERSGRATQNDPTEDQPVLR
jgi:hypothetical protein